MIHDISILLNRIIHEYLKLRYQKVLKWRADPMRSQAILFREIIGQGQNTIYGKKYDFQKILTVSDYQKHVPISSYNDLRPYIELMMKAEKNVLWPGQTFWYAKSSGTTQTQSKFIPISDRFVKWCFTKTGWDALSMYYHQDREAAIFKRKSLVLCGSYQHIPGHSLAIVGDISSILLKKMPAVGTPYLFPNKTIQLEKDWGHKMDMMVKNAPDADVTMITGVPSWMLVLLQKIKLEYQVDHIHQIWPNLRLYWHGGVSIEPYKNQFEKLMPATMQYMQGYNASEGYFAIQDEFGRDDMLLLTDHGVFYEFISLDDFQTGKTDTLNLSEIEIGQNYVTVISTCSGLWRYVTGDTVRFTSINPYRIQYTGRTQQHINMFGEELMIRDADQALAAVSNTLRSHVRDYTVAPIFFTDDQSGRHHWMVEFETPPKDESLFCKLLDQKLCTINSDYEAKRNGGLILDRLKLTIVPSGSFHKWLAYKGKIGGQNKVPRLSGNSKILNQIWSFAQNIANG